MLTIEPRLDEPERATLRLEGEFGLDVAGEVAAALRLLELQNRARTVVDLRGVDMIDSTGLRVIVEADRRSRTEGREFEVIALPGSLPRRLLELTLLTDLLAVLPEGRGASPVDL